MTPALAKTASHEFLRRHSVEVNETLALIEAVEELSPQDARSVAIRSVVLSYVIGIRFGADARRLKASLEQFGLLAHASARERELLNRSEHTPQEKVNATWLTECVQSLAWCLGLVELDPFRRMFSAERYCADTAVRVPLFCSSRKLLPNIADQHPRWRSVGSMTCLPVGTQRRFGSWPTTSARRL